MASKMAGTATWINENTLQLNARFVEAMHGDKITCSFDGDKVNVSSLNSVSENSKTDMEKEKAFNWNDIGDLFRREIYHGEHNGFSQRTRMYSCVLCENPCVLRGKKTSHTNSAMHKTENINED
jgi:hypothetical protein